MKNKDWNINFTRPAAARALTQAGFSPLLSQVLALRGVENAAQAKTLLYGGKETLHNPLLMLGMDGARARVMQAIGQHADLVQGEHVGDILAIGYQVLVVGFLDLHR